MIKFCYIAYIEGIMECFVKLQALNNELGWHFTGNDKVCFNVLSDSCIVSLHNRLHNQIICIEDDLEVEIWWGWVTEMYVQMTYIMWMYGKYQCIHFMMKDAITIHLIKK